MTHQLFRVSMAVVLMLLALPALAKVKVITATTDLAAITREVGGSRVTAESLSQPTQDLHRVEARPSFVVKLSRADLVVRIGMDLDMWVDPLLVAARNADLREGGKGYVDASAGIAALEVPRGKVSGADGDIHIYGNPHYWLDPLNGKIIARNIRDGLVRVDPAGQETYENNYARFCQRIDEKMTEWQRTAAGLKGTKVVVYHTTWSYFLKRFGLEQAGTVEPKPGIPPSASHVTKLMAEMKRRKVPVVLTASYYPTRFTNLIKRETQAAVVTLPTSVGGAKGASDYFALFDTSLALLTSAVR